MPLRVLCFNLSPDRFVSVEAGETSRTEVFPLTLAARFSIVNFPDVLQSLTALHECAATAPPTQSAASTYLLSCL